ncbi:hypothetical protein MTO96_036067 [Rhipicephalus appendiculatus]
MHCFASSDRKHYNCGNETAEKSEEHVKFGFIWSAISHTLEMPTELSETLLAECMANMSTANLLQDIKNIAVKMDSYDQAGMMSGEITVAGKTREIHLWGYKVRTQGKRVSQKVRFRSNDSLWEEKM